MGERAGLLQDQSWFDAVLEGLRREFSDRVSDRVVTGVVAECAARFAACDAPAEQLAEVVQRVSRASLLARLDAVGRLPSAAA